MNPRWIYVLSTMVILIIFIQPIHGESLGEPAPDFTLKSLSGDLVSLSGLRGKIVILDFWATWCGPCRVQMKILDKVYSSYVGRDVVILSINIMEDFKTVKDFVNSNNISWTVLMDANGRVAGAYGVQAIPTIVVIDRDGIVQVFHTGVVDEETLKNWIDTILEGEATSSSSSTPTSVDGQGLVLNQTMIAIAAIAIMFVILIAILTRRRKDKLLNI